MGFFKNKRKAETNSSKPSIKNPVDPPENALQKILDDNLKNIKEKLGESSDIVIREIRLGKEGSVKAGIIYTDGLTDIKSLQDFITEIKMLDLPQKTAETNLINDIKECAMTVGDIQDVSDYNRLFTTLLSGDTILLIDGYSHGLVIANKHWEERGVTEPTSQTLIRGPRDGFSENIRLNTALVRRRIANPNLWIETKRIGTYTNTNVAVLYIKGIADEKIVKEVHTRLDRIKIDGILESGYVEELIEDSTTSPFPTVINTERPDAVAASLLEGKVAIMIDGTPFVLIVPALFIQFFQSPEDHYQRHFIASLVRILRYFAYGIAMLAPSVFIALTTFHQEMIPTALLISLAAQREGVPFPAFIEALIMEVTFEVLREAGVRMPRSIGPTMSIVGAFVIGTAAVEAGMITATMVIVVSITAISSFVAPAYDISTAARMLRFILMALAASFGLFGITVGLIAIVLHLCSLRSFGIPYMSPLAPYNAKDQKDALVRLTRWKMFTRPDLLNDNNPIRQQAPSLAKPEPNKNE